MSDWNSGDTYVFAPFGFELFRAAGGSPIGGLLAGTQGISSNFAAGNAVATANPGLAVQAITNPSSVNPGALVNAYQQGMLMQNVMSPFQSFGTTLGNVFGTGVGTVGGVVGTAGKQASTGIAQGTSGATTGVVSVGAAGVSGALSGIIPGLSSGVSSAFSGLKASTGSNDNTLLLIGGGVVIVALYLTLT